MEKNQNFAPHTDLGEQNAFLAVHFAGTDSSSRDNTSDSALVLVTIHERLSEKKDLDIEMGSS